jgi:hypothetical protein
VLSGRQGKWNFIWKDSVALLQSSKNGFVGISWRTGAAQRVKKVYV